MKTTYVALTVAAVTTSLIASAEAGVISYSFEADQTTASVGDTVNITVHADIDPGNNPFEGLAAAVFDIHVTDPVAGGTIDNTPPLHGLRPSFMSGEQGTLLGSSIVGIIASQFPPLVNPGINTGTELELYSFAYTITEADPREILFNLVLNQSTVYTGPTSVMDFESISAPLSIQVMQQAPAPGALALLGAAGLVGVRRKRK